MVHPYPDEYIPSHMITVNNGRCQPPPREKADEKTSESHSEGHHDQWLPLAPIGSPRNYMRNCSASSCGVLQG